LTLSDITISESSAITGFNIATISESTSLSNDKITITLDKGIDSISFPIDEFTNIINDYYCTFFTKKISNILNKTFSSLLLNRDFLGHQLNHYIGNITEDEFNSIIDQYLMPKNIYDINNLYAEIRLLMNITKLTFDSDQISILFNCEIDDAENAISKIINDQM